MGPQGDEKLLSVEYLKWLPKYYLCCCCFFVAIISTQNGVKCYSKDSINVSTSEISTKTMEKEERDAFEMYLGSRIDKTW